MHVKQVSFNFPHSFTIFLFILLSFSNCTLPKGGSTLGLSGRVTGNTALGASVLVRMVLQYFQIIIRLPLFSTNSTPAWCTTTSCHTT